MYPARLEGFIPFLLDWAGHSSLWLNYKASFLVKSLFSLIRSSLTWLEALALKPIHPPSREGEGSHAPSFAASPSRWFWNWVCLVSSGWVGGIHAAAKSGTYRLCLVLVLLARPPMRCLYLRQGSRLGNSLCHGLTCLFKPVSRG